MLFLLFRLGGDRYVLDACQVKEVLPLVELRAMPRAPAGVVGLLNYHGRPVPVVDLAQLALDRPARCRLSTRIALVQYPDATGGQHLLGLMAESVTDTVRREAADFGPAGAGQAPWLGAVAADAQGLIQQLDLDKLLPASVRAALFA